MIFGDNPFIDAAKYFISGLVAILKMILSLFMLLWRKGT